CDGRITPSRRRVIQSGLLAGLGLAAGGISVSARGDQTDAKSQAPGRSFRMAHLTDMHVEPGPRKAGEGWAAALKSLHSQLDRAPDLIVTGGDHVMDSFEHGAPDVAAMWDLYQGVLHDNTDIPVRSCIGNHD